MPSVFICLPDAASKDFLIFLLVPKLSVKSCTSQKIEQVSGLCC